MRSEDLIVIHNHPVGAAAALRQSYRNSNHDTRDCKGGSIPSVISAGVGFVRVGIPAAHGGNVITYVIDAHPQFGTSEGR
jgi:hypothetical protein